MKRQVLIRGAAIAFAGVAASVFAAQQFMGVPPQSAELTSPGARDQVNSASLMGSTAPANPTSQTQPELSFDAVAPEQRDIASADLLRRQADADSTEMQQITALDDRLTPSSGAALADDFQPPLTLAQAAPRATDASCAPNLTAITAIDGLIDMRLQAPCAPNARVVISHGDLAFSAYTDEAGVYASYIPALSVTSNIEVFLPDQTVLQAQSVVPDAAQHARVIVQWTGGASVLLHAYHRGAAYGQAGHIHASRPFDPAMDAAFVLSLGEARGPEPMLTQVYSIPSALLSEARLELELSVTTQTCGRDMTVYVAQKGTGQHGGLEEMVVAMPDCSSAGGLVVVPLPMSAPMQAQLQTPVLTGLQN